MSLTDDWKAGKLDGDLQELEKKVLLLRKAKVNSMAEQESTTFLGINIDDIKSQKMRILELQKDIIKCEAIIGGLVNEGNDYKQKYQCSLAKGKLSAERNKKLEKKAQGLEKKLDIAINALDIIKRCDPKCFSISKTSSEIYQTMRLVANEALMTIDEVLR